MYRRPRVIAPQRVAVATLLEMPSDTPALPRMTAATAVFACDTRHLAAIHEI
jgi:hypothetical protein